MEVLEMLKNLGVEAKIWEVNGKYHVKLRRKDSTLIYTSGFKNVAEVKNYLHGVLDGIFLNESENRFKKFYRRLVSRLVKIVF